MKNSDISRVKLMLYPLKANPAPPVGSVLGQRGVNIMDFCKQFNAATQSMDPSLPVTACITVNKRSRTFKFIIKLPPVSRWILHLAKKEKGAKNPGAEIAGTVNMSDLKKIAAAKVVDSSSFNQEAMLRSVMGTVRSMGLEIVND